LSGPGYLRLILLGAAIGIPAALLAALFLALVHRLEDRLWTDLPDRLGYDSAPWLLVIGLPVVGAAVVVAARTLLPGDGGHSPLAGIGGGVTPLRYAPGVALAALGTLSFGAVLGPEAPLIALGSAVGIAVTLLVRLEPREEQVVATAGSFSAISALFGGPLVAGMLLLEGSVGLGALAIPTLLPGLVSAAVGYLIFIGFGDWGGIAAQAITVPNLPAYEGTTFGDIPVGLGVGVAVAFLVAGVRPLAVGIDDTHGKRFSMPVLLLAGGLAVGILAELADASGGDSQEVLFSGQAAVPRSWPRTPPQSCCSCWSRRRSATRFASAAASGAAPCSRRSSSGWRQRRWPSSPSTCHRRSRSRSRSGPRPGGFCDPPALRLRALLGPARGDGAHRNGPGRRLRCGHGLARDDGARPSPGPGGCDRRLRGLRRGRLRGADARAPDELVRSAPTSYARRTGGWR
jgi:hypothetical protein